NARLQPLRAGMATQERTQGVLSRSRSCAVVFARRGPAEDLACPARTHQPADRSHPRLGSQRPFQSGWPLLHNPPRAVPALPAIRWFDAGWSSPVARQAHNLKVVGSNPTPATIVTCCPSGPTLTGIFLLTANAKIAARSPANSIPR